MYSSLLLSALVIPERERAVRNFKDLSEAVSDGTYKCYVPAGTVYHGHLLSSENIHMRIVGEHITKKNGIADLVLRRNLPNFEENVAFIGSKELIMLEMENEVILSDEVLTVGFSSAAFPKNSPIKKRVDTLIHRIWSSGLYTKFLEDYIFRHLLHRRKAEKDSEIPKALSLSDLSGAFTVLLLGYCVAVLVLFVEIFYKRLQK